MCKFENIGKENDVILENFEKTIKRKGSYGRRGDNNYGQRRLCIMFYNIFDTCCGERGIRWESYGLHGSF